MAFGRPSPSSQGPFHRNRGGVQGQGQQQQSSFGGGHHQQAPQTVQFSSGNRGAPVGGSSRHLGLTDRFSKIAEERTRAASQIAANAKSQSVPIQRPTTRSGPLRTMPRRPAAIQRQPVQLQRGGRGGPVRGPVAGRRAPPPSRGPAPRGGGVGKATGNRKGGRGGGAKKASAPKKPLTQSDLDSQLDAYLMKDSNSAKARLDSDMDSYMAEDKTPSDVNAPTIV